MIFIRPSGGKFCIRSMPMKDNAEHYSRRPVVQRGYSHTSGLSDKGMANGGSSIVNGGSGTDPPLRAVLDPVAAPTIVSEIHTAVPEPHTPWEPF